MTNPRHLPHLLSFWLLAAACNPQSLPPPPPPIGTGSAGGSTGGLGGAGAGGVSDRGAGGRSGPGGAGADGLGGNGADLCPGQSAGCVSSCTTAPFVYLAPVCEAGTWTCPSGSVSLATCDANSCAQIYQDCCDDTTGAISAAPCSSDGQVLACPDGTRYSRRYCVPAILGISNCSGLAYKACDLDGQRCYSGGGDDCVCRMTPGTDAGLAWDCPPFIP